MAAFLATAVAVLVGILGAGPAPAVTPTYAYDPPSYVYDAPAQSSTPNVATTYAQGSPAAPVAVSRGTSVVDGDRCTAAETGGDALNAAGRAYPKVLDPRTGDPIPAPPSGLSRVPVGDRVPWGAQQRGAYIKEWYDQGYSTPEGGWSNYDIHHVTPREYGGTNDFNNLVPVERTVHQQEFNPWWMNYGG